MLVFQYHFISLLGLTPITIGLIVFGVVAFYSLFSFLLGLLGDRIGYKKTLIISDIIPTIGTFLLGITQNTNVIGPLLILTGIGGGASGGLRGMWSPGLSALVASNWKDEREGLKTWTLKFGCLSS